MTFGVILAGLVCLVLGGQALVIGASSLARRLGLPEFVIGLLLIGFGTSIPEMASTLNAAGQSATGLAVGNIVGSNVANILLVLGIAALIRPLMTSGFLLARDFGVLLIFTAIFSGLAYFDRFDRTAGLVLLGLFGVYLVAALWWIRPTPRATSEGSDEPTALEPAPPEPTHASQKVGSLIVGMPLALIGCAGTIIGAEILIRGALALSADFGANETVIGLTLVAVGTSLPEGATTVIAVLRRQGDLAVGSLIGSNIFNIGAVMGLAASLFPFSLFAPQPAAGSVLETRTAPQGVVELPVLGWEAMGAFFLSVVMVGLFGVTGRRIERTEGVILVLAFLVYLGLLFEITPTPLAMTT